MNSKKNEVVLKRHSLFRILLFPIAKIIAIANHYKVKSHYKIKKGENYLILSNHQTDLDGILVMLSFNKPIYPVATDTLMSNGVLSKILSYTTGIIPKKKGIADYDANKKMLKCFEEGGSLLLFPEGNRTYAEFQYSFTSGFSKFIKLLKKPIILFNINGGTGCLPRFGNKRRKGKFYGKIRKIIKYDEYKDMSDEELYNTISQYLKVYDSNSKNLYKSKTRAEYLERIFFVCPKCGKMETLVSSGNFIECTECGFKAEYTENLHLVTNDDCVKFTKTLDWYNYQIRFVKNYEINSEKIFTDDNVVVYEIEPFKKRKLVAKGTLKLDKDSLSINEIVFNVSDILIASPIGGRKLGFSANEKSYLIVGSERFNPLKYVLMFNKLETKMKINNLDIHYTLNEREE